MSQAPSRPFDAENEPEPTWGIASLFPPQGMWSEEEYLGLPTNRLVEFVDGTLEFPPMPTTHHQRVLLYLYRALLLFASARRPGEVLVSPLPMRLRPGKYREPDILFMLAEHSDRIHKQYWDRADLVMEVVSESKPDHDHESKRVEYAEAGIPEYWIVDPQQQRITVLTLAGDRYAEHGTYDPGQRATSVLLPGFGVDVAEAFGAARI
jgi:Uma2 family endonuclease